MSAVQKLIEHIEETYEDVDGEEKRIPDGWAQTICLSTGEWREVKESLLAALDGGIEKV
jgi:hypothetical protein